MKISIVTPNYNYAKYIGKTIESVLNQDYDNIEHIIVDDGSTDNSLEVIKNYQNKFPDKIKVISQSNRGQTSAVNIGLKHATGDIIGWINSDDTYCGTILSDVIEMFKKNIDYSVIYGNVNFVDIEGRFIFEKRHVDFDYWESVFSGFANTVTSNAIFWRYQHMLKVGFLDENLRCNMDGEYFSRLLFNTRVLFINRPLANFRVQRQTKESEKHSDWDRIVRQEVEIELKNALSSSNNRLLKFPIIFKFFYVLNRGKRILKRLFFFCYFKEYFEKLLYKRKYGI